MSLQTCVPEAYRVLWQRSSGHRPRQGYQRNNISQRADNVKQTARRKRRSRGRRTHLRSPVGLEELPHGNHDAVAARQHAARAVQHLCLARVLAGPASMHEVDVAGARLCRERVLLPRLLRAAVSAPPQTLSMSRSCSPLSLLLSRTLIPELLKVSLSLSQPLGTVGACRAFGC
jgi:hypothetical protein